MASFPCMMNIRTLANLIAPCEVCAPYMADMRTMGEWYPVGTRFFLKDRLAGFQREALVNEINATAAVLAVQADNCRNMVADPDGEFPACKNKLGTWICERCGADVRHPTGKACPAIPPEKRWSFKPQNKDFA